MLPVVRIVEHQNMRCFEICVICIMDISYKTLVRDAVGVLSPSAESLRDQQPIRSPGGAER